jgi:hypothetical protein
MYYYPSVLFSVCDDFPVGQAILPAFGCGYAALRRTHSCMKAAAGQSGFSGLRHSDEPLFSFQRSICTTSALRIWVRLVNLPTAAGLLVLVFCVSAFAQPRERAKRESAARYSLSGEKYNARDQRMAA